MSLRTILNLTILSLALVSLWGFLGCGGDDSTTSLTNTLTGEDYTNTRTEVNGLVDSTMSVVSKGLAVILTGTNDSDLDMIPGIFYDVDPTNSNANPEGEWYVLTASSLAAGVTSIWVDSLQFLLNGTPNSDFSAADGLKIKHLWQSFRDDTTNSYNDYHITGDFTVSDLDLDLSRVNGSSQLTLVRKNVSQTVTTWKEYNISLDVTDVTIARDDWVNGCPASGTVDATVELVITTDTDAVETVNYDFAMAFSNGTMTATVTSGTKSVDYTVDFCTPASAN